MILTSSVNSAKSRENPTQSSAGSMDGKVSGGYPRFSGSPATGWICPEHGTVTSMPGGYLYTLDLILMQNFSSRYEMLCSPGWIKDIVSLKCLRFFGAKKPFGDALAFCKSEGGSLVRSHGCERSIFLAEQLASRNATYWIGLKKNTSSSDFLWVDTTTVGKPIHLNWYRLNPNISGNVPICALINSPGIMKGFWVDELCSKNHAFVCEKDPDKLCPKIKYGPNCGNQCSVGCAWGVCDVRNGTCLYGCVGGYKGAFCNETCVKGTYGPSCAANCSQHCAGHGKECSSRNGTCTHGCDNGYREPTCIQPCATGTYGPKCSQNCSVNCAGRHKYCNISDGECAMGCVKGFTGPLCDLVKQEPYDLSIFVAALVCAASTLACFIVSSMIVSREMGLSNVFTKTQESLAQSTNQEPSEPQEISKRESHELPEPQNEN
ncbi:hypothetical protein RRG08_027358 [Elysia crispata]|uniref:C-type lectin domain-containing protein n=1 Tax=Elysia crispata TaxID=231223 RepID=A0AAE1D0N4_9GAST|nr:hypothetical protein RRG08_027358 [Elysia crispata]